MRFSLRHSRWKFGVIVMVDWETRDNEVYAFINLIAEDSLSWEGQQARVILDRWAVEDGVIDE